MANEILMLREIGVEMISRSTHIEAVYIEYMINKDFENLRKANALGYAKIISREFNINLDSWCEEYKTYLAEMNSVEPEQHFGVNPKLPSYTPKSKSNYKFAIVVGIIALIAGGYVFVSSHYFDDMISSVFGNRNVIENTNSIIEEAEKNIKESEKEEIVVADNNESETNTTISAIVPDSNQTITPLAQETAQTNQNNTPSVQPSIEQTPNLAVVPMLEEPKVVKISTKKMLWLGIKDLKTMKKESLYVKNSIEIDLNKTALILTGHGELSIDYGDTHKDFNNNGGIRFHIDNGFIQEIDFNKFVQLNKGSQW